MNDSKEFEETENSATGNKSAETPCYAIGFDLNEEDGIICCFCYKNILKKHEMPNLLVAITRSSKRVHGDALCPKCGLPYLRGQTEEAAKYIKEKWL